MIISKIISALIAITAFVVIPIQLVTTFVIGLLVSLTFGLLLIPISLIWIVLFFWPLLALSYLYDRIKILRPVLAMFGIPIALLGNIYVSLMPSMGEWEGRFSKLVMCRIFPYTWRYNRYLCNTEIRVPNTDPTHRILEQISKGDKALRKYIDTVRADFISRR